MTTRTPLGSLVAAALSVALPAQASSWRTYVSPTGSDANISNSCGLTTPCRQFAAALTVTDPNGEIVVLASGNFGAVTINQSVTINAPPGIYAGISVFPAPANPTGNGVTIATAGIDVTLNGLTINGMGGNTGIYMSDGARLTVDNCNITNFAQASGIYASGARQLRITNSTFRNNYISANLANGVSAQIQQSRFYPTVTGFAAVLAYSGTVTTTTVDISDSIASGGWHGFRAETDAAGAKARIAVTRSTISNMTGWGAVAYMYGGGTADLTISDSLVTGNGYGIHVFNGRVFAARNTVTFNSVGLYNGGGTLESDGNNSVRNNDADTVGTITGASPL
jgi:hypothetical protein